MKKREGGYKNFDTQMDSLKQIFNHYPVLNGDILENIYASLKNLAPSLPEKQRALAELQQDACVLGADLMRMLNVNELSNCEFAKFYQEKEYIYRALFKSEFEPVISNIK